MFNLTSYTAGKQVEAMMDVIDALLDRTLECVFKWVSDK